MSIALKVEERNLNASTGKKLRRQGLIPAVFYGRGVPNEHYQIPIKDLEKVLQTDEHIVELQIGSKKQELALIQELQRDCLNGKPIHISFLKVRRGEATWMTVSIEVEGDAPGVKDGGDLMHILREIEIECTPENAPDVLHVNISNLNVGDTIYVRDITLPKGVKIAEKDLDLEVISVHVHHEEAAPDLESPQTEVIGEKDAEKGEVAPAAKVATPEPAKKKGE